MNKNYKEHLEHFFGCYLHQNWDDFYEDYDDAVADFLTRSPTESALKKLNSLGWLLEQQLNEKELEIALDRFHNAYYPIDLGITFRQWLIDIYNQIAKHLGKPTIVYQESQETVQSENATAFSNDTKSNSSDNKTSRRKTEPPIPRFEQPPKSSSNLLGCFLIVAILSVGCATAFYLLPHLFSDDSKNSSLNKVALASPTSTPSQRQAEFRVVKTVMKETYREFIVVLSPGQWFDTGIPVTRDWIVTVVGERQSDSWVVQLGNETKERPDFPREVKFYEKTVQPTDCLTLKVFAKGSKTQKLKIMTQIPSYTYKPDKKILEKENKLLSKIESQ